LTNIPKYEDSDEPDYFILERTNYFFFSVIALAVLIGVLFFADRFISIEKIKSSAIYLVPIGFYFLFLSAFLWNLMDVSDKIVFKKDQIDFWWTLLNKKVKSVRETEIEELKLQLKTTAHGKENFQSYEINIHIILKNKKKKFIRRIEMGELDNEIRLRLFKSKFKNLEKYCKKNYKARIFTEYKGSFSNNFR